VPFKGDVNDYIYQVKGSLRSSFYYLGSKNIIELHKKSRFIRISAAGMGESKPHSITMTNAGGSYNLS
jgi:IMP dehydrogenase